MERPAALMGLLLFILVVPLLTSGEGPDTGNSLEWSSSVVLEGNITVGPDDALVIKAGTIVELNGSTITVEGSLRAEGRTGVISINGSGSFLVTGPGTARFNNTIFRGQNRPVVSRGASVTLSTCDLSGCVVGVDLRDGQGQLYDCNFMDCVVGVRVWNTSLTMDRCQFHGSRAEDMNLTCNDLVISGYDLDHPPGNYTIDHLYRLGFLDTQGRPLADTVVTIRYGTREIVNTTGASGELPPMRIPWMWSAGGKGTTAGPVTVSVDEPSYSNGETVELPTDSFELTYGPEDFGYVSPMPIYQALLVFVLSIAVALVFVFYAVFLRERDKPDQK